MMDINVDLLQWFITSGSGIKNENISNKELAEELHKPITRNFYKRKEHSLFIDNIQGEDLIDLQLISNFNKERRFSLCVFIDIYRKYAWVIPLKDKKRITIKKSQIYETANQIKYGCIKAVNFIIGQ